MAGEVGLTGKKPYSRSLIERIRASKETQWRRLLIWVAVAATTSVGLSLLKPHFVPTATLQVAICVLTAGAAFAAALYCLATFALERTIRFLFTATAFSALGAGIVLQTALDLRGDTPAAFSLITTMAWLFAGTLLLGGAHSDSKWRSMTRAHTIGQFAVAGLAMMAFPLTVLPYVISPTYFGSLCSSVSAASVCRLVDMALGLIAAGVLIAALRAYHRRYMDQSDGLAGLLCYLLVASALGLLFCCASSERFDFFYSAGQLCLVWSWIALVAGNGVENAFAHKEAGERLEELETLHEVSWSLVGAGTVDELLKMFVDTLVSQLGARIAAVFLAEQHSHLKLAAIAGYEEAQVGKEFALASDKPYAGFHSGHTARAFASKELEIVSDVFVDVEFVPWKMVAQDDGCAASIPLVDHDICIGVLNVYFSDAYQLTKTRLRLLTTIAAAATSAIENALSQQTERSSENECEARVAATRPPQP